MRDAIGDVQDVSEVRKAALVDIGTAAGLLRVIGDDDEADELDRVRSEIEEKVRE